MSDKINNIPKDWDFWFSYPHNLKRKIKPTVNKNYYFIFDCLTNEILLTSSNFKEILGYSYHEHTFAEIINFLHPDDVEYVIDCEKRTIDFINKLSYNEQFRFITSYSYRSKTKNGNYINIRQNYHAIEVNEDGNMVRALVYHELIDINETRKPEDYKIFDLQTNRFIQFENRYNLTKREYQILDLIKEGLTSNEISKRLNLSKLTIDTHRKNILSKTNSRNFMTMMNHEIAF